MARVIAGMTISLDGFVADPSGSAARLYPDLEALRGTAYMPVLLGAGLRLFEDGGLERVQLEKLGVKEIGARTSLSFRGEVARALWTRRPGPSGRCGRLGSRAPQVPDP